MGACGILIPEAYGGLGLGLLEAALAAEALGRRAAPSPFLGSGVLAPLALVLAGEEAQKARWLPDLAAGRTIAGAALSEAAAGARDQAGLTGRSGRLCGSALFVIDGAAADLLILADREGGFISLSGQARARPTRPCKPLTGPGG
jgi:alkylation response protein AidB-like acyl-CoA dehydrogenase